MVGQTYFSHKQLMGVGCDEIQELLFKEKNINWDNYKTKYKRGWSIKNKEIDSEIPVFTQDRDYIENVLRQKEEKSG